LVILALAGISCADGDDEDPGTALGTPDQVSTTVAETTTTAPPATTTTAAPTPEEEVLAAYQGYWSAVNEAFSPPEADPEVPGLQQHATGEVLSGILERVRSAAAQSSVFRIPEDAEYSHRAEVVVLDGATATVRDCNVDDSIEEHATTSQVIDEAVSTRLYIAMLLRESGTWKVATLERESTWEGVAGCALE